MRAHDQRRRRLVAQLGGQVAEIGAGAGLTFAHYPRTVTGVVAVEPDPRRRALATRAAGQAAVPIHVLYGVAEALPLADAAADAAVVSLALCSVADVPRTLGE